MAEPFITFTVDVGRLNKLAAAFPMFGSILAEEMDTGMDESGMLLTAMVAARTPVNYGLLRSSIGWPSGFEKSGLLDTLRGVVGAGDQMSGSGVSTSTYVTYVEEGTPPHWAPIGPLKLWAMRKFGDERVAYAVQRQIARYGIKSVRMFYNAWRQGGRGGVEKIWKKVPVKAIQRFEAKARAG